jgi:uncharacterized cupin superfamily protein
MPTSPRVTTFKSPVEAQRSVPEVSRVVSGHPQFTVWNHYTDSSEQFFAGIWAATPGCWAVRYTENEFCHLLQGRIVITSDAGERLEFRSGDSFVMPAGFSGTWEVIEECRKLYAIFEPRARPDAP